MSEYGNFHIAIIPPDKIGPETVKAASQVLNQDVYQVRRLFSGKLPRLIAHYTYREEAVVILTELNLLGLHVYICEESVIRRPPPLPFKPNRLAVSPGCVDFINQNGSSVKSQVVDVFLMIKGNKISFTEVENTTTTRKLSVGKTLLTGGIPIFDKVKQKSVTKTVEVELVLRLYNRNSIDPIVEIKQFGVDYKFLGSKFNYSSLVNFSTTVNELKTVFRDANYDDSLAGFKLEEGGNNENEFELDCRLLWLYYKSLKLVV